MPRSKRMAERTVAFVLGGGGHMGAYEVGMLEALVEAGIEPQLVVGTSVGALNGAGFAADPTLEGVAQLREVWLTLDVRTVFGASFFFGAANFVRSRTHMHSNRSLRAFVQKMLPAASFGELKIPFQCVAASIERAAEHWFSEGPLVEAILASCAVPGLLPPVEVNGEHFVDGGIVNSVPMSRAIDLGATEIYVLHAGRIDKPLIKPTSPIQVALVAFEIARRHRFAHDLATVPDGVTIHVLPTGEPKRVGRGRLTELNYRDFRDVARHIDRAHRASAKYLEAT